MLGNLNSLFASVNVAGLKDDLMAYGTMAAGAIVAPAALSAIINGVFKATKLDTNLTAVQYGKPIATVLLGIIGGNMIARRFNRNLGMGLAVGATALGLQQLVVPHLPASVQPWVAPAVASLPVNAPAGYLRGAVVEVEEVNGAPISIENVAGLGASFASTLS